MEREARLIHVEIDLEAGDGPIRGLVHSEAGGERSFEGWIALAAAVEEARHELREVVPA